ncbi:MAG: hypothetical protein OEL83_01480 [Desulforhopalus sp.]|nr:hypothetical protein [Desulforhopalus sp.]
MKQTMSPSSHHNVPTNHLLKRRLKIILGIALGGFLLLGGLVFWVGFAAFKGVADFAADARLPEKVAQVQQGIEKTGNLPRLGCLDVAQNLLNVEVWLDRPVAENIDSLKIACLQDTGKE